MPDEKPTHDYVITAPCGCVVELIADLPKWRKDTSKHIAAAIRRGDTVQRVARDTDAFRDAVANFGHHCQAHQEILL